MPTFWHYKVLTIISVDQCTSFFVLAASKVLWLHWVLAQVLDTLKVWQPFRTQIVLAVWQHFGNHLSCPCATCALNFAWLDCHCYRHGMNRYRSPRVRWIVDGALFCVGPCQTPNAQRYAHQWLEFSLPPLLPWRAWLEEHQACNTQVRTTDHPWASLGPAMLLGDSSARLYVSCVVVQKKTYIYIYVYICIYMYMYIYIYVYIYGIDYSIRFCSVKLLPASIDDIDLSSTAWSSFLEYLGPPSRHLRFSSNHSPNQYWNVWDARARLLGYILRQIQVWVRSNLKLKEAEIHGHFDICWPNHTKFGGKLDPPRFFSHALPGPPHATLQLQIGQAMRIAARGELLGQAEVETWKSAACSMEDFHGIFMGKIKHVFFRMFIESNGIVMGFLMGFWWGLME